MKNKKGQTFKERFRDVISDPNNQFISRVQTTRLMKGFLGLKRINRSK